MDGSRIGAEELQQSVVESLRKNVTIKEGIGVAFDLGLATFEKRAMQVWPDMRTVLVSNVTTPRGNQIEEYSSYGYVLLENGAKSTHTVPNRDMARMGIPHSVYDKWDAERLYEQNNRVAAANAKEAGLGEPFKQDLDPVSLEEYLAKVGQ